MKYKTDTEACASLVASLIELSRDAGTVDSDDVAKWLIDAGVLEPRVINDLPCEDGEECVCMDMADSLSINEDTCLRITERGRRAEKIARQAGITERQLHILRHALGLDDKGQGRSFRNHFVTGEGSDDHAEQNNAENTHSSSIDRVIEWAGHQVGGLRDGHSVPDGEIEPPAVRREVHQMERYIAEAERDLAELRAMNARLREAGKRLSFAAQTTGGTAGRDETLVEAIAQMESALARPREQ